MNDIMKSIYDMMGKHTNPYMKDSAPTEHVESFFKVFSVLLLDSKVMFP